MNKLNWAQKVHEDEEIKSKIDDYLMNVFEEGRIHHIDIGYEYEYDNRLEIYFNPNIVDDYSIGEEVAELIASFGFSIAHCNFTNGTEQKIVLHSNGEYVIGERLESDFQRWTEEDALN